MTLIKEFIFDPPNFLYLIFIFVLTYISQFYFRYFTRQHPIPGPIPFPLIGNFETYHPNSSQWARELQKKYGDIFEVYSGGLFTLNNRQIWISNASLTDKLLSPYTNNNFPYRITENEGLDKMAMTSKGIVFNRNVNSWAYNRRIVVQVLMAPKFLKTAVKNTEELFFEMEKHWEKLGYLNDAKEQEIELDLANWMRRFMTDSVFNLTTNTKSYALLNYFNTFNTLNKDERESNNDHFLRESEKFVNYIRLHFVACIFFKDTPKILRTILPANRKKSRELLDVVAWLNSKVLELIRERKKEIEKADPDEELSADMLTLLLTINTNRDPKYVKTTDKDNLIDARPMSEDEVRENVYEIMGGGIDTTANTFCYVVYYLTHYPEVRQKMLQEMEKILGKDMNREITYEDLNKLNYCGAIIKEVSRIMPTVSVLFRVSAKPDEIAGYKFLANTQFFINVPAIQMHPSHWNQPEKFDPDRFMDSEQQIPKNALLHFGGGARVCMGKQLAILQLKALMVLLYRKYDVELMDMSGGIKYSSTVVNHCEELPVKIKVKHSA
ncbi:cytochrome P450 [Rhizophagus irregularis]|uniref:Cytochrome P450 n=1 Tax=Rhizophagus irregularis TaxID=588596 RepID=A0A2N1N7W8_9GLOM|nr:cytochrome P450 [Rhizophagus irregularis]